ncbi:metallophosphoesterase family protein [Edaphobacter flagellatus]|uniref:metallophosphoesterase family protein n=1 Tax=Edaphobacter flagellatus TaxID=1933044 RepID=UPI0021B2E40D|nr:metallophosphoesterase [Edaphobacter flagellatus]
MNRRDFLRNAALGVAAPGAVSTNAAALVSMPEQAYSAIRFGVIADLHHDFTFDAPRRLEAFVREMNELKPDFILDLGDFCCPVEKNRNIVDIWNGFPGTKHHVIGNHEMDQRCTREQVVDFWKMPGRYYSFDQNGFHFVVLDGNDPDPRNPDERYPAGIDSRQLEWLRGDLSSTKLPTIVFCHQGFDNSAVRNRESVRILLENTHSREGNGKVVAVFSGHFHNDYYNLINGIHYIQINSATYQWCGEGVNNDSFAAATLKSHPLMKHMAYYQDPLWAYIEIDADGILKVRGRKTNWMGKSPRDLKLAEHDWDYPPKPGISSRQLRLSRI